MLAQLLGSPTPRVATPRPDLPSRGADVVELAEAIGEPLLPWQATVMDRAHVVQPDGTWAHSTVAVVVARQSGKTHAARMRVLAGLFLWGERLWLGTAQSREVALETFRAVVETVQRVPWLADEVASVRFTNGQEELRLKSGARYKIVAPTPGAARGLSVDGLLLDEARELRNHDVFGAFVYTTQARPNPQVWLTSNAGDARSAVLNAHRDRAYAMIESAGDGRDPLCWLEWSAPPGCDVDDVEGWAQANPGLGHMVRIAALEARAAQDPEPVVRTEMLCQWVDELVSPWPSGAWGDCAQAGLELDPERPTWLAVDTSPDRSMAALVAAQQLEDGRVGLRLLSTWDAHRGAVDQAKVAADVATTARAYNTQLIAYDRWTSGAVAARLESAGHATADCSGSEFAQACDELLDAMAARRMAHPGQGVLDQHMAACARKPAADGGWRIVRQRSSGQVNAACAAAMALHHATIPPPSAAFRFA